MENQKSLVYVQVSDNQIYCTSRSCLPAQSEGTKSMFLVLLPRAGDLLHDLFLRDLLTAERLKLPRHGYELLETNEHAVLLSNSPEHTLHS